MRMRLFWLATAVAVLLPGVGRADNPKTIAGPSPASAPKPTPAAAVVPFEKLLPFLPETPAGWTSEKPNGSTTDVIAFTLSTATRTYQKGDDDNAPVATVTIIDAGGHQGYFDTATSSWKFTKETPEGYDKGVEIDGLPGYEHFNKTINSSSLCVITAKRYFIQIELTNQDPKELREWMKKIDLKKLGELK